MEKVKQKEKTKESFFFQFKEQKTPEKKKTTNKTEIIYQKESSKH